MADLKMIEELTNAFGPSGFEEDVVKTIYKYGDGLKLKHDAMHNVYAAFKKDDIFGERKKPLLMLDAHTDECGFIVQSIMDNGLLSIIVLGGVHLTNIPAHPVLVRNSKGELIKGITTSKPVHFMNAKERSSCELDIEKLYIDIGASSREEVINEYGVHPGDPAVPDVSFSYDGRHGICYGKAFDNRLGCTCILETMKALQEQADSLSVTLAGAFASQEEVGERGAIVTAQQLKPDLAIVFEGSPADDLYFSAGIAQGALKKGAQIRRMDASYISNPAFIEYAHAIGDKYNIPYQDAVRRGGGTDAGKISITDRAVPVLVLGVPSRYVHTHYNFCAVKDIEAVVNMAVNVVKDMDNGVIQHILRQDIVE